MNIWISQIIRLNGRLREGENSSFHCRFDNMNYLKNLKKKNKRAVHTQTPAQTNRESTTMFGYLIFTLRYRRNYVG